MKKPILPFMLTLIIVLCDQGTKALVAVKISVNDIAWAAFGDFFWLVHQRNTGAAFSIGDGFSSGLRVFLLIALPLGLMAALIVYYFKTTELSKLQRWTLCGIIGGGIGNIIDRIFRADGVVDFLSFKFYGLFGLERWPTFNVADMSVVICCFLMLIAGFFYKPSRE
jgi:signal peptidase II